VLSASRVYAYDPNSVIAKFDEEKIIRQELQESLVGQLFRQLGRIDAKMLAR
jgi:outer membrane lipopolysaccharide assembly protein LptE/RlpB